MTIQDNDPNYVSFPERGRLTLGWIAAARTHGAEVLHAWGKAIGLGTAIGQTLTSWTLTSRIDRSATDKATQFALIDPTLLEDRNVFVVERKAQIFPSFADWRANISFPLQQSQTMLNATKRMRELKGDKCMLVVDIDQYGDLERAITELLKFRAAFPEVPVVIGSEAFARHDYSQHRAPIADVSVRLPCSKVALALAINCAISNNIAIRERH